MSRFTEVFPRGKAFLPVIHVDSEDQARRNVGVALSNGADGVFLIGHSMEILELRAIHASMRTSFPDVWTGINYLGTPVSSALVMCDETVSGLWTDDAELDMTNVRPDVWAALHARVIEGERGKHLPHNFLYFGGVHFKGQDQVSDPAEMARVASPHMDVVTTSGPGTGRAADPKKIEAMKRAIGDGHLGLASGCTPENVKDYKDYVDAFLVATSIGSSFRELDPFKVERFAINCR